MCWCRTLFQLALTFYIVWGHCKRQRIRKTHHSQTRHKTIWPMRGHYPHQRTRYSHTQTLGSQTCHLSCFRITSISVIDPLSSPLYSIANTYGKANKGEPEFPWGRWVEAVMKQLKEILGWDEREGTLLWRTTVAEQLEETCHYGFTTTTWTR